MKSGKSLEYIIHAIEETLRDRNDTEIRRNVKLVNKDGIRREIDVLVSTTINEIPIQVAFECKDYKKPIDVKVIDAFIGKCSLIPQINSKVIVAKNGFTKNAKSLASTNNVLLYQLDEVPYNEIFSKYDIYHTTSKLSYPNQYIAVNHSNDFDIALINADIYSHIDNQQFDVWQYFEDALISRRSEIISGINQFRPYSEECELNLTLFLKIPNSYAKDAEGNSKEISGIKIPITVNNHTTKQTITQQQEYNEATNNRTKAILTEYNSNQDNSLVLIENQNIINAYIKDKEGILTATKLYKYYPPIQ